MADETQSTPHVNPWIIAVSVMFSTFMEVLNITETAIIHGLT